MVLLTEAHFVTLCATPPRSFVHTVGLPSIRPSVQPGTIPRLRSVRPRVRRGAAAAAVTDNNARFFDNLRRPRRRRWTTLARAPRRRGAAARDHRDHLLNGKKQTRRHKGEIYYHFRPLGPAGCSLRGDLHIEVDFNFIHFLRFCTYLTNEVLRLRDEWHENVIENPS